MFVLETWVMTLCIGSTLGLFHHQVSYQLMVKQPQRDTARSCGYSPLDAEISEEGLGELETYIDCRQKTVAQYIATRPIMDLFLEEDRRPGARV